MTSKKLFIIDNTLSNIEIPHDHGRLPTNISSHWGSYTANQWKNWTLVHSLLVFNDVLPKRDYHLLHTFSQACRIVSIPVITSFVTMIANHFFLKFGKELQSLYGDEAATINLHMHCHLADCTYYGNLYGFDSGFFPSTKSISISCFDVIPLYNLKN